MASGGLGISPGAGILAKSDTAQRAEFLEMKNDGIAWVRLDLPWPAVQPERDRWYWGNSDRAVRNATDAGLQVLFVAGYAPNWAMRNGDIDEAAFGRFMSEAGTRYAGKVDGWEIWNEPNLAQFWNGVGTDPAGYAAVLTSAARALHETAPDTPVLSGGLAPARTGNGNTAPVQFLDQTFSAAGDDLCGVDGVAVHPYGFPLLPTYDAVPEHNLWSRVPELRDIMVSAGMDGGELWYTEFGAPTGTARDSVTEEQQRDIVRIGIEEWAQDRDAGATGPLFLYSMRDAGTNEADREDNFGMREQDGTPKPALTELREGTAQFG